MNINRLQFRQALASLAGRPFRSIVWPSKSDGDLTDDFRSWAETVEVSYPVLTDSIFVMSERLPILNDIQRKQRSVLVQLLLDRNDETALVVDSFLGGKDSLFLAQLFENRTTAEEWVSSMCPARMSLTIRPIDNQHKIMIASLGSYVSVGGS
jgi:hypothetical protein